MKTRFYKSDWFAGVAITLSFLVFSNSNFIESLERNAYDFAVKSSSRTASDKITIIAIDDKSIEAIGRYPWSRDIHAKIYDVLANSGAKVIAQTTFFPEPQLDAGLKYIRSLKQSFNDSDISAIPELFNKREHKNTFSNAPLKQKISKQIKAYEDLLNTAEIKLDTDKQLATSIRNAGNIVFNLPAVHGKAHGKPDRTLPNHITKYRLAKKSINNNTKKIPLSVIKLELPIAVLGEHAASVGATLPVLDSDGSMRKEALIVDYYGDYYPSLALMISAQSLNLNINDIQLTAKSEVQLGRLKIKTDSSSLMHTFFYHQENSTRKNNSTSAFNIDSFSDVLLGKINPEKYKDKIVLIGPTALGVGVTFVTPINPTMSPVIALAHSVSSILNEDFFIVPQWATYAQLIAILLIALYIIFILPKLGAVTGLVFTSTLSIFLLSTQFFTMTTQGIWLQLIMPTLLLISGHVLLTTKHFFLSEKGKERLDIESSENNRMLGLSLQGQGQLDMAFEKFRKLSVEKSVLELLYNLALDYERKRQFNKARSVYNYISDFDNDFRDISKRTARAQSLEDNILFNSTGGMSLNNILVLDDKLGRPKLGRYEIEAELGKGAMGSVYLGKDPKISRTVAIKTMALSQEFEDDELIKAKERFFREAQTAGRLTHPNIVTIFDADEEHDLAFIAMEYLKGDNLKKHITSKQLLPIQQVLSIIKRAADAIDYAHQNNVVHRDIKPANIMWDSQTDTLKITDFGIARITDASKTKTGMILGTPSYMSPEQLSGQKVTGQSDLFSLGIMLFQMVTGKLPFTGDSMTALMFKIANQSHPTPESINPKVPRCVSTVINRAMEKNVKKRYKRGKEMVSDINKCLKIIAAENTVAINTAAKGNTQ